MFKRTSWGYVLLSHKGEKYIVICKCVKFHKMEYKTYEEAKSTFDEL